MNDASENNAVCQGVKFSVDFHWILSNPLPQLVCGTYVTRARDIRGGEQERDLVFSILKVRFCGTLRNYVVFGL